MFGLRRILATVLAIFAACAQPSGDGLGEYSESPILGGELSSGDAAVCGLRGHTAAGWFLCSCVLIAPDAVLTAAHCVDNKDRVEIAFGGDVYDPVIDLQARSWIEHPLYEDTFSDLLNRHYDVALVRLPTALSISPAVLGRGNALPLGTPLRYVGFGSTTLSLGDSGLRRQATSFLNFADDFWLISGSNNANTCSGDSGGPQYATVNGQELLVGVTSFGQAPTGAPCTGDSVATRIDSVQVFIDSWL